MMNSLPRWIASTTPILTLGLAFGLLLGVAFAVAPPLPQTLARVGALPHPQAVPGDKDLEQIVRANNSFAVKLLNSAKKPNQNLVFAPLNIQSTLAMASAGSAGPTLDNFTESFNWPSQEILHPALHELHERLAAAATKDNELAQHFSLWTQQGSHFEKPFLRTLKQDYAAELFPVDFADADTTREKINSWVSARTKKRIPQLVNDGDLDASAKVYLAGTVLYRGSWAEKFDPKNTKEGDFYLSEEKKVTVPFMKHKMWVRTKYAKEDKLSLLEMSYLGRSFTLVCLIPHRDSNLSNVERSLTPEKLTEWLEDSNASRISVALPKFKLTSELDLKTSLKSLGLVAPFRSDADFSRMSRSKGLFVNSAVHKVMIEFDEEGSTAAAATGLGTARSIASEFRLDGPFVFLIRDRQTGCILFIGRVLNPTI
jgi:serpin B